MVTKKTIKLKDLANTSHPVDISETEQIMIRGLNLREMVSLFVNSQETFLPLLDIGLQGASSPEMLAPFLLTAPALVAQIIALASDEPESATDVENKMPATTQLIALSEIWHASVPDPKKAKELLSEVTALLQKNNEENKASLKALQTSLVTTSPPE